MATKITDNESPELFTDITHQMTDLVRSRTQQCVRGQIV